MATPLDGDIHKALVGFAYTVAEQKKFSDTPSKMTRSQLTLLNIFRRIFLFFASEPRKQTNGNDLVVYCQWDKIRNLHSCSSCTLDVRQGTSSRWGTRVQVAGRIREVSENFCTAIVSEGGPVRESNLTGPFCAFSHSNFSVRFFSEPRALPILNARLLGAAAANGRRRL